MSDRARKPSVPKISDWGWRKESYREDERGYTKVEENEGDRFKLQYTVLPCRSYCFIRVKREERTLGEARWHTEFRNLMYAAGRPISPADLRILLKYESSFLAIGDRFPEEQTTMKEIIEALENVQRRRENPVNLRKSPCKKRK